MYAIVRSGGTQQKVAVGDVIEIDQLRLDEGSTVSLPVLMLVDGADVTADADKLANASVTAEVLGATKGPKITILKYKNKTGYRKRQGHRQRYTQVKITGISTGKSGSARASSAKASPEKASTGKTSAAKGKAAPKAGAAAGKKS